jgi:protocatechuate 3,4-dioxygenase beta subunit
VEQPQQHDHDRGLAFDLATLSRRRTLTLLGGGALALLVGCASDDGDDAAASTTSTTTGRPSTGAEAGDCATIPEETAGPFPGDGSNGPDVLAEDGIVRSDIRSSFGSSSTTARGVPLTIGLRLSDSSGSCAALAGAAVYVWHCDRDGGYSLYSEGVEGENYLRGVQEADGDGRVRFTSIFPGAYPGRWPHVHFEVYEGVEAAVGRGTPLATSQIAFPEDACRAAYATRGYEASVGQLDRLSLAGDMVFGDDGGAAQLGTVSGSVDEGFAVELAVPVTA